MRIRVIRGASLAAATIEPETRRERYVNPIFRSAPSAAKLRQHERLAFPKRETLGSGVSSA